MRLAFDTNILAYLSGVNRHPDDLDKIAESRRLLAALRGRATLVAPAQALAELFVVLTRAGASRAETRETILHIRSGFAPADTTSATLDSALDCAAAHKLQLWDAIILTAAAESGAVLLLSEDMQSGFQWRGTTVVNPLAARPDRRLAALFA
ncbi:PIN domain-containing protein [Sandaracinobacteroides saxicola]|uniref:PIN domain-containing protein n=1 Tax=Sandaracinobacteroides saxicola TaxID=2759707 RepID=A0A7G5IML8_9SPHN|nr:PIN domain-containing protein [Sandaracinobacteroides saxicola]